MSVPLSLAFVSPTRAWSPLVTYVTPYLVCETCPFPSLCFHRPLPPPQRGGIGRPPNDHRRVLGGILWVARTGSSWREIAEEYGKWETAYRRHESWVKHGLWQRILRVLGEEDLPGPAMKEPN